MTATSTSEGFGDFADFQESSNDQGWADFGGFEENSNTDAAFEVPAQVASPEVPAVTQATVPAPEPPKVIPTIATFEHKEV